MGSHAFLIIISFVFLFGFVVFFGAPYLPTLRKHQQIAFDMMALSKGQTMLELGSGDGRMLKEAARRGIKSIGYEMNPILYIFSILYCWRYRSLITVKFGNYWKAELPDCDGIYVFLLGKYMDKLNKKIIHESSGNVKLVSFAFVIPGKKPDSELEGMYLYSYKNL